MSTFWSQNAVAAGASAVFVVDGTSTFADVVTGDPTTLVGGAVVDAGVNAVMFDGVISFVTEPPRAAFDAQADFAIEVVVQSIKMGIGTNKTITAFGIIGSPQFTLKAESYTTDTPRLRVRINDGANAYDVLTPSGSLLHGKKNHIVASLVGGVISVWINGVSVTATPQTPIAIQNSTSFRIGRRSVPGFQNFAGWVWGLALFKGNGIGQGYAQQANGLVNANAAADKLVVDAQESTA